jgi:predicted enzyme related to lactoylglutathione lyase
MAAKKKARAKAASKASEKKTVVRAKAKRAAPAKKAVSAKKAAAAPARIPRKEPETLRLKSFTPSLTVNDLAKSMTFYADGLGFFVGQRWMDGDVLRGVMLKAGTSELGISQDDWKLGKDRQKGQGFRVFLNTTQDIDAIASRVKAAGFTLTEEPADNPAWGVRSFSLDDPDGYHLTVTRDL